MLIGCPDLATFMALDKQSTVEQSTLSTFDNVRSSLQKDILISYSFCRIFAVNDSGSKMHIVDREGRVILTLKSKFFSAHNKWYIYSGSSTNKEDKIATVKPQSGTVTAEVWQLLLWLLSACAALYQIKWSSPPVVKPAAGYGSRVCFHAVMVVCRCS